MGSEGPLTTAVVRKRACEVTGTDTGSPRSRTSPFHGRCSLFHGCRTPGLAPTHVSLFAKLRRALEPERKPRASPFCPLGGQHLRPAARGAGATFAAVASLSLGFLPGSVRVRHDHAGEPGESRHATEEWRDTVNGRLAFASPCCVTLGESQPLWALEHYSSQRN